MQKEIQIVLRPARNLLLRDLRVGGAAVCRGRIEKTAGEDTGRYNDKENCRAGAPPAFVSFRQAMRLPYKSGVFHRNRFSETRPKFQRESDELFHSLVADLNHREPYLARAFRRKAF